MPVGEGVVDHGQSAGRVPRRGRQVVAFERLPRRPVEQLSRALAEPVVVET